MISFGGVARLHRAVVPRLRKVDGRIGRLVHHDVVARVGCGINDLGEVTLSSNSLLSVVVHLLLLLLH